MIFCNSCTITDCIDLHRAHIWSVNDKFMNRYETDPDEMKPYENSEIKYFFDSEELRYYCPKCPPPYNDSSSGGANWNLVLKQPSRAVVGSGNVSAGGMAATKGAPIGCRWKTPYLFTCDP